MTTKIGNWIKRNPKKNLVMFLALVFISLDYTLEKIYFPVDLNTRSARTSHIYYHHGLKENIHSEGWWGHIYYIVNTNSLGFRDRTVRGVPTNTDKWRVLFMGDSFTEGLGVPEEKTFVGLVEDAFEDKGYDIQNAGVVSSSPVVYYNKARYYLEQKHLKFDELFVFLDISDIHDEYLYVQTEHFAPHLESGLAEDAAEAVDQFLIDNSFVYHSAKLIYRYVRDRQIERGQAWWTLEKEPYELWGKRGLEIAEENMQRLADLCKDRNIPLTIAVYPWTNLVDRRDLDSLQVRVWRDFARRNRIGFINYFPLFINDTPAGVINDRYCIPDDIHWNEAGHELIADQLIAIIGNRGKAAKKKVSAEYIEGAQRATPPVAPVMR